MTDLVYLWVNGRDPKWLEKKYKYSSAENKKLNKDAMDECRTFENDELKYSLRSAEKNLPFVNKIFLITDEQVPSWLNLNTDKLRLVDLKEIVPADKLPLFNSCAIETRIPYIEDLDEKFIYANDDMLFWKPLEESFFFEGDKPVVRVDKRIIKKKYRHLYGYTIFRAYTLMKEKYGDCVPYFPHHNADSYKKSTFLKCAEAFKEEFEVTLNNRFRDFSNVQRMLVSYFALYSDEAVLKNVSLGFVDKYIRKIASDSAYYDMTASSARKIMNLNSKLLCVNDSRKASDRSRELIKKALEKKFPDKSVYEK